MNNLKSLHARRVDSSASVLCFHRTDTHLQFLSVVVALSIHSKVSQSRCGETKIQVPLPLVLFSSHLKSKVGKILDKIGVLRITLNLDCVPVSSKSHTHPTHHTFKPLDY